MPEKVSIDVDRDGWTKGLQLSINIRDEKDGSYGYRIAGPKFNGSSERVFRHTLTERDASEIRSYLDQVFPRVETPDAQ